MSTSNDLTPEEVAEYARQGQAAMVQKAQAPITYTAPRVTPADIEAQIVSEHYFTAAQGVLGAIAADGVPATAYERANAAPAPLSLLTFCVLVLRNGFTVTGESACASPENFNAEKGREIARAAAVSKCWPLLGYELRTRLANQTLQFAEQAEALKQMHSNGSEGWSDCASVTPPTVPVVDPNGKVIGEWHGEPADGPTLTDGDAAADLAGTLRPDNPSADGLKQALINAGVTVEEKVIDNPSAFGYLVMASGQVGEVKRTARIEVPVRASRPELALKAVNDARRKAMLELIQAFGIDRQQDS